MSKKRKRLRKNKEGLFNPRKVLDDGHWMPISFFGESICGTDVAGLYECRSVGRYQSAVRSLAQ